MTIALLTGPYDPSNTINTINTLISAINGQNPPNTNILAATLSGAAVASGKVFTLNRAAGQAVTLPASTGAGAIYSFFIGTTITSNTTTFTAAGSDTYAGIAVGSKGNFAANAGVSTVLTLNGSTEGGFKGDYIIFRDLMPGLWSVEAVVQQSGSQATPFN